MEIIGGVVAALFLLLLVVGLAFGSSPECGVCGAPIYRTKAGYRHRPGHAPSDGHRAVLAEKKR